MLGVALLLWSTVTTTTPEGPPPTTTTTATATATPATAPQQTERQRKLCAVTPELRIAFLYGSDGAPHAAAIADEFERWDCLKVFELPFSGPLQSGAILEASKGADIVGVDWIVVVLPASTEGYATARLVEIANLGVVTAHTGAYADVVKKLLGAAHADLARSRAEGVKVTLVLQPSTYVALKALQARAHDTPGVVEVGAPRLTEGKGIVVVKFKGSVDALAAALAGVALDDKSKHVVDVKAVKLRRIELAAVAPTPP